MGTGFHIGARARRENVLKPATRAKVMQKDARTARPGRFPRPPREARLARRQGEKRCRAALAPAPKTGRGTSGPGGTPAGTIRPGHAGNRPGRGGCGCEKSYCATPRQFSSPCAALLQQCADPFPLLVGFYGECWKAWKDWDRKSFSRSHEGTGRRISPPLRDLRASVRDLILQGFCAPHFRNGRCLRTKPLPCGTSGRPTRAQGAI